LEKFASIRLSLAPSASAAASPTCFDGAALK